MSSRDRRPPTGDDNTNALARSEQPLDLEIDRFDPWAQDNAPPTAPRGASAFQFGRLLWYKWSILGVALLIAVPSVLGIWLLTEPMYRARATLKISASNERVLYKTEHTGVIPMYDKHLNSQVGIILGHMVLNRVLDHAEVKATSWYREPGSTLSGAPQSPLERLVENLKVRPRSNTFHIDIDFVAHKRSDAKAIVNAIVDEYVIYVRNEGGKDLDIVHERLTTRKRELSASIRGKEAMTKGLSRALTSRDPDEAVSLKGRRLDEAEAAVLDLQRELKLTEHYKNELEKLSLPVEGDSAGAVEDETAARADKSPTPRTARYQDDVEWWRAWQAQRDAEHKLDRDGAGLGEKHPTMQKLRSDVAHAEEGLREREKQLEQQWAAGTELAAPGGGGGLSGAIRQLGLDIKRMAQDIKLRNEYANILRDAFDRAVDDAQMFDAETYELKNQREQLRLVLHRLDEFDMEGGLDLSVQVISPAFAPSRPDKDRRLLLSGMALFAGLMAGIGLAYVRVTTNKTIHTVEELAPTTRAPFLGYLPYVDSPEAANGDAAVMHEHYRMLRTALLNRIGMGGGNALLITSAGPNTGKTTVAINLATSLAECGNRVLLVDADMRNPDVSERMGIQPGPGLVAILRGEATDADALVQSDIDGLSVLPAGTIEARSDSELLANGRFEACLSRWREAFDVILFDAPPVLPVADAQILSRHLDGTILVARARHCNRLEVAATLDRLNASGGKLMGTVFIGSDSKPSYYRYSYAGQYASKGEPGTDRDAGDEESGAKPW